MSKYETINLDIMKRLSKEDLINVIACMQDEVSSFEGYGNPDWETMDYVGNLCRACSLYNFSLKEIKKKIEE